jgi:hypothetical protein
VIAAARRRAQPERTEAHRRAGHGGSVRISPSSCTPDSASFSSRSPRSDAGPISMPVSSNGAARARASACLDTCAPQTASAFVRALPVSNATVVAQPSPMRAKRPRRARQADETARVRSATHRMWARGAQVPARFHPMRNRLHLALRVRRRCRLLERLRHRRRAALRKRAAPQVLAVRPEVPSRKGQRLAPVRKRARSQRPRAAVAPRSRLLQEPPRRSHQLRERSR